MVSNQNDPELRKFISGKSAHTLMLYSHFIEAFGRIGDISVHPAKTMIGISNGTKRIAWITRLGKNFIHVVFPFQEPYEDNLCFKKIAQVPGGSPQFNHHFRMYLTEDLNEEVLKYMAIALRNEKTNRGPIPAEE